ncbi:MAG: hypothetical protein FWG04_04685 [Desulfovibrionaceae bacterium]|nr:hypothetical protein [Desulfovibrionaceae bacterium]
MAVSLHRYSPRQEPGDLSEADLLDLWGLLKAEDLVRVFFHDGAVADVREFMAFATSPAQWFYAAKREGEWIGIGVVNGFSGTGAAAFGHLASFACGRDGSFREAGMLWHALLRGAGVETLLGVIPACYTGALRWAKSFGYVERMRLKNALRIVGRRGGRVVDAVVTQIIL